MPKRQLQGIVVSNKMDKTIVVSVKRKKEYAKYKTSYMVDKKFKVHSEMKDLKIGDKVIIEECNPISKEKKWKIVKKV